MHLLTALLSLTSVPLGLHHAAMSTPFPASLFAQTSFTSTRRNYMVASHRKDAFIEWMIDMLTHSFVLDAKETYSGTMSYIEELVDEHRRAPERSRLKEFVPSIGAFHTHLPLAAAFKVYDTKYSITKRRFIPPSFNEVRHILNLAQVMAISEDLDLITFDGDQTLYNDGGNFDASNTELALGITSLLANGVKVAVITAAGYGLDGSKYEVRLRGLLQRMVSEGLTAEQVGNFYVFGGECNYLLHAKLLTTDDEPTAVAKLLPVLPDVWQVADGPKPYSWPQDQITTLLDLAETSMKDSIRDLKLRARILRKERAIGVYPGGPEMVHLCPDGHGSQKLKQEALDEVVLRIADVVRANAAQITIPYCIFNGGSDAWLDIGNKSVAVGALQAFLRIPHGRCIHVGDQFLNVGNDIAARKSTSCAWIINPRETGKILQHVLKFKKIVSRPSATADGAWTPLASSVKMSIYTGEVA